MHDSPTAKPVEMFRDDELREMHQAQLNEAAERAMFHRREAERWERIGRASGAALVQLDSHSPVGDITPGDLIDQTRPSTAGQTASPTSY